MAHLEPLDPRVQAALLEFAGEFLVFTDQRGALVAAAGAGLELAGFRADVARMGRHIAETIHPDDLPAVLDLIERARIDPGFRDRILCRAHDDEGQWRWFEASVVGVPDHPVLGTGAVIRVQAAESPDEAGDDRFASLAAHVPHGVLSGDARGWVVFANDPARDVLGLPGPAVLGEGWRRAVHPDDLEDVLDAGRRVIATGTRQHATFRVRRPGEDPAEERWATLTVVPLGSAERRTGWVATLVDMTERFRADAELADRATHGPLTGLPNRALLADRLDQACTRRQRGDEELCLLFLDLDGFKQVNDRFGHAAGDEAIRTTARRIVAASRPDDTVGRLGGDEFVVVLEGTTQEEAAELARAIERAVAAPLRWQGHTIAVAASIGLARAHRSDGAAELLARADAAMYARKRSRPR